MLGSHPLLVSITVLRQSLGVRLDTMERVTSLSFLFFSSLSFAFLMVTFLLGSWLCWPCIAYSKSWCLLQQNMASENTEYNNQPPQCTYLNLLFLLFFLLSQCCLFLGDPPYTLFPFLYFLYHLLLTSSLQVLLPFLAFFILTKELGFLLLYMYNKQVRW